MKWNRIVAKLGGMIILLFLVVMLPMGFVINQVFKGFYYKSTQEKMTQLSDRYAEALSGGTVNVQMIMMMAEFSQINSFAINREGKIIASTGSESLPAGFVVPRYGVGTGYCEKASGAARRGNTGI
ncbi:hypothetical protein A8990_10859 [Paenibacillus taihuensis]|uniref:Uncharacterized protein n=1 Tax=Paenibacillus taihuensis TaxID=1156355 RepID=A0A3D9S7U1_9BACL|nr:hypothetical protein [Paenibacillus taihuensis]REE88563.1 hypothetical protein A8990_10859 [Paenibacillus taihuensis]